VRAEIRCASVANWSFAGTISIRRIAHGGSATVCSTAPAINFRYCLRPQQSGLEFGSGDRGATSHPYFERALQVWRNAWGRPRHRCYLTTIWVCVTPDLGNLDKALEYRQEALCTLVKPGPRWRKSWVRPEGYTWFSVGLATPIPYFRERRWMRLSAVNSPSEGARWANNLAVDLPGGTGLGCRGERESGRRSA
jgi:hypothetical protein